MAFPPQGKLISLFPPQPSIFQNLVPPQSGVGHYAKEVNSLNKLKKVIKSIKEIDKGGKTKLAISDIIKRFDRNLDDEINNLNDRLRKYCESSDMIFINNENRDKNCLNGSRLHLNKKGNAIFAKNIMSMEYKSHIFLIN